MIYNVLTKVLTPRLTRVKQKALRNTNCIHTRKTHFGRVMIVHEVLHELGCMKKTGIVSKLDFQKDYDKVSWSFLEHLLHRKGF